MGSSWIKVEIFAGQLHQDHVVIQLARIHQLGSEEIGVAGGYPDKESLHPGRLCQANKQEIDSRSIATPLLPDIVDMLDLTAFFAFLLLPTFFGLKRVISQFLYPRVYLLQLALGIIRQLDESGEGLFHGFLLIEEFLIRFILRFAVFLPIFRWVALLVPGLIHKIDAHFEFAFGRHVIF